ncbi:hypothetical protein CEW89_18395 [Celeribacter ethanolicus]|uniref:Uncharacterized protein n=1 Tax=Celeribacter ethanolicus TaxID=1758178 RepID=A0A291GFQ9_9RHOB|nr:DUF4145 domain-containing protein [Celeribacter ethanolicus]ATG49373.1 hypothetical protein CEW89_18395 [Celeribacter ethanolicus]
MADIDGFSDAISHSNGKTELDLLIAVVWFLTETSGEPTEFDSACDFLEANGIRHNINRSRLKGRLTKDKRISAPKGKPISIAAPTRKELQEEYGKYIPATPPKPKFGFLGEEILEAQSETLKSLNVQLNLAFEHEMFDCTAVMMRRIMESLLIKAFSKNKARDEISDGKNLRGLEDIIIQTTKTDAFHLARGSEKTMRAVKSIGDKGAHSPNYSITRSDIANLATDFRALIADLVAA